MLTTVPLKSKPLCILKQDRNIYIGSSHGSIYILTEPYTHPRLFKTAPGPVSALVFHQKLFYGTWDGIVYTDSKSIKLGTNMIKAMAIYGNKILVSVDFKLIILNFELEVLEEYLTKSKIYCMDVCDSHVSFGMGIGLASKYSTIYEQEVKMDHETTILSIKGELTGSSDGKLNKNNITIYKSEGWIRSIYDENLFTSGQNVIKDERIIYSHDDEVVGVLKIANIIISIGLDFSYKIYEASFNINKEEEEELLNLLNS